MKKLLVLTAALALFAAPAMASIVGGGHDLSGKNIGNGTVATDEICVFCHTPHAANVGAGNIPLSNRAFLATGSALCMSCHDGGVEYADITNKSNADNAPAGIASYTFSTAANFGATYGAGNHPVGVIFNQGVNGMVAVAPSIIANGTAVSCSSCHDVHEPLGAPFLKMNNTGSLLCLACHNT